MAHPRQKKKKKQQKPASKQPARTQPAPKRESLPAQMRQANQEIDLESKSNPWLLITALVGAAFFIGAYYHLLPLQQMSQLTGGLSMLDLRITGYGLDDVQELSAAMDNDALGQLNWTHKTAGILFPLFFGLAAFVVIGMVVPSREKLSWFTGRLPKFIAWFAILAFVVVDIIENFVIEAVLHAPEEGLAVLASTLTVSRWILLILIVVYALIAFVASKIRNFAALADQ